MQISSVIVGRPVVRNYSEFTLSSCIPSMKLIAAAFIGLYQIAQLATGFDYSYDDQPAWPGLCATGKHQSPISIENAAIDQSVILKDLQINYGTVDHAGLIISKYGFDVLLGGGQKQYSVTNVRGFENDTFIFDQFHAHWGLNDTSGSEHRLAGKAYPLEFHLVHNNAKYAAPFPDAQGKIGGLVFITVLFEIGEANPEIDKFLVAIKNGSDTVDSIDLYGLIPKDMSTKFFGYDGSLSAPTCDENLLQHVAKTIMTLSEEQMETIRALVGPEGEIIAPNYRHLQPLNGRKVYITEGMKEEANLYCQHKCGGLSSCGDSKYGSYCKGNGVCYGLYHKDDGYCFQPTQLETCDDFVLKPLVCDFIFTAP